MAKKTATPAAAEDEVITVEAIEIIPAATETKALALVDPFEKKLTELREQYSSIEITDKASLDKAQEGVKTMTALRSQVEKRRLEIFRPVLDLQKNVKAKVDKFIEEVKTIEQPIRDKINAEELRLQEEARKEHLRRVGLLEAAGFAMVGQFYTCGVHRILFDQVDAATPEQIEEWVAAGQAHTKAEAERKAKEEAEAEARRKEAAEWEEFQRWKAAQAAAAQPAPAPEPTPRPGFSEDNPFGYNPHHVNEGENPQPVQRGTTIPLFDNPGVLQPAPIQPGLRPGEPLAPLNPSREWATQTDSPQAPSFAAQLEAQAAQTTGTPETEDQLAAFRKSSISFLRTQPEARVYYNQAIDDVLRRFQSETHTKPEWVEIFKMMKR